MSAPHAPLDPDTTACAGLEAAPDRVTPDIGEVHVLRLCLDLQLDALMLTIGAASGQERATDPPWRRWVDQDVELACSLAAAARAGGATLPPSMGSDVDAAVPTATVNGLRASYASMVRLLSDLVTRTADQTAPPGSPSWRQPVERARDLCVSRLAELDACRAQQRGPSHGRHG
jgi:hypothetical protein